MQRIQRNNMGIPIIISCSNDYVVISFFWDEGSEKEVKSYYYPCGTTNEYKKQIRDILHFVRLKSKK